MSFTASFHNKHTLLYRRNHFCNLQLLKVVLYYLDHCCLRYTSKVSQYSPSSVRIFENHSEISFETLCIICGDVTKNLWGRKCVRRAIFRTVEVRVEGGEPYFVCNTSNCVTVRPIFQGKGASKAKN